MNLADARFGKVPACDAGLVRHDDDEYARGVQPTDRVRRAGEQPHLLRCREVVNLLDQRAVAVQEHGLTRHEQSRRRTNAAVVSGVPMSANGSSCATAASRNPSRSAAGNTSRSSDTTSSGADAIEQFALDDVRPGVHPPGTAVRPSRGSRSRGTAQLHRAEPARVGHVRERECRHRAAPCGRMHAHQSRQIEVEVRVAVHHHRGRSEVAFRALQAPPVPSNSLPVARVVDPNAERGAVAERGLDLFRHVSDAQHEPAHTAARSSSSCTARNGRSPTAASALGRSATAERSRVPSPPHNTTTGRSSITVPQ